MTLADRIKLIDDMIRENPDVTIKDYIELVGEVRKIASAPIEVVAILEKKIKKYKINPTEKKYYQNVRHI